MSKSLKLLSKVCLKNSRDTFNVNFFNDGVVYNASPIKDTDDFVKGSDPRYSISRLNKEELAACLIKFGTSFGELKSARILNY